MLRDGYDAVGVDMIARAAGIGRTTFFRYFGTKSGVIWAAFDGTIAALEASIARADLGADPLDIIRQGIVSSTDAATRDSEAWLERFVLIDSVEDLRFGAYQHWEDWKHVIAQYLAECMGVPADAAVPMSVAGACQGVFVGSLRALHNRGGSREDLLLRLDGDLRRVCGSLRELVTPPSSQYSTSARRPTSI